MEEVFCSNEEPKKDERRMRQMQHTTKPTAVLAFEPGKTILFPSLNSCMEYYGIRSTRMLRYRIEWEGSFLDWALEPSPWDESMVIKPDGQAIPLRLYRREM